MAPYMDELDVLAPSREITQERRPRYPIEELDRSGLGGLLDSILNPIGAIVGAVTGSMGGGSSGGAAAAPASTAGASYTCPAGMMPNPAYSTLPDASRAQAAAAGVQACIPVTGTMVPAPSAYGTGTNLQQCSVRVGTETHRCSQAGWQNALATAQRLGAGGMDPQMALNIAGRIFNIPACLRAGGVAGMPPLSIPANAPLATLNAQGQFSCPSGQSTAYNTQNQVVCVASTTARRPTSGSSKGKRSGGKGGRRTKGMRGFGEVSPVVYTQINDLLSLSITDEPGAVLDDDSCRRAYSSYRYAAAALKMATAAANSDPEGRTSDHGMYLRAVAWANQRVRELYAKIMSGKCKTDNMQFGIGGVSVGGIGCAAGPKVPLSGCSSCLGQTAEAMDNLAVGKQRLALARESDDADTRCQAVMQALRFATTARREAMVSRDQGRLADAHRTYMDALDLAQSMRCYGVHSTGLTNAQGLGDTDWAALIQAVPSAVAQAAPRTMPPGVPSKFSMSPISRVPIEQLPAAAKRAGFNCVGGKCVPITPGARLAARRMQNYLNKITGSTVPEDGVIGPATVNALATLTAGSSGPAAAIAASVPTIISHLQMGLGIDPGLGMAPMDMRVIVQNSLRQQNRYRLNIPANQIQMRAPFQWVNRPSVRPSPSYNCPEGYFMSPSGCVSKQAITTGAMPIPSAEANAVQAMMDRYSMGPHFPSWMRNRMVPQSARLSVRAMFGSRRAK